MVQVVLAYGIRERLQSFLEVAAIGLPISHDVAGVVAAAQRLLADMDVLDDAAAPPQEHTQTKFHRCFRLLAGNALIPDRPRNHRWARRSGGSF